MPIWRGFSKQAVVAAGVSTTWERTATRGRAGWVHSHRVVPASPACPFSLQRRMSGFAGFDAGRIPGWQTSLS